MHGFDLCLCAGEAGTSDQACSDSYQGPSAASEVEVQAIQSYIYDHRSTIKGYINFHAYSQLWMSNWGYTVRTIYTLLHGVSGTI
jgi:hypothetical protein